MRGLKPDKSVLKKNAWGVAPLVGAWIETPQPFDYAKTYGVAPLVGAWIETQTKQQDLQNEQVAPLVGAWIET